MKFQQIVILNIKHCNVHFIFNKIVHIFLYYEHFAKSYFQFSINAETSAV